MTGEVRVRRNASGEISARQIERKSLGGKILNALFAGVYQKRLLEKFVAREEVAQFKTRGVFRIRAVDGIRLDA